MRTVVASHAPFLKGPELESMSIEAACGHLSKRWRLMGLPSGPRSRFCPGRAVATVAERGGKACGRPSLGQVVLLDERVLLLLGEEAAVFFRRRIVVAR